MRLLCLLALAALAARAGALHEVRAPAAPAALSLQIVHLNDFHARFEPVSRTAGSCKEGDECIGGLPRVSAAIAAERVRNPDALVLNGGDNFQGTLWYSLFRWNVTAHFMNEIPWDALTIGNHEFDHGVAGLVPFLQNMPAPFVIANMDDSKEPSMHGLWKPSIIVEKAGHRIGIVGYIWKDTPTIARTEGLEFSDELEALDREAGRLKREEGIEIVVALSHAGLDVDLEVAAHTQYADVIVGAHSHTLLYNGTPPSGEHAYGPYPEVVRQDSGRTVLVVQASCYTKYLGNLTVHFDDGGEVASWEGNPIWMSHDLPEDADMVTEMVPWKAEVEGLGNKVVGSSKVELDKLTHDCYHSECSLGNFVTDAMVDCYVGKGRAGSWTAAAIAFTNAGGLRTNIAPGDITYGDLVAAQPFEGSFDLIEMQGHYLLETLEDAIERDMLLQWSGLRVQYDYAKPARHRVMKAEVLCDDCDVPAFAPIDADKWYNIVGSSFVIDGGDNFLNIRDHHRNRTPGPVDIDVFQDYLSRQSPLLTAMDGRLTILNGAERRARVAGRRGRAAEAHEREPLFYWKDSALRAIRP